MSQESALIEEMNDRSREVFRRVVECFISTGEPIGSRTLTRAMDEQVSAATIRNVMQDLELLGLLDSPHVSAGRIPTQLGLRMFVDGLLEIQTPERSDKAKIDASLTEQNSDLSTQLDRVGSVLSGITKGASLVLTAKQDAPIRHIEFVPLAHDRALAVIVFVDGQVENRVFAPDPGQTPSSMREAANFLNAVAEGKTLGELRRHVATEIERRKRELDSEAAQLIELGLAAWETTEQSHDRLIVWGRSNLLDQESDPEELERIRLLFDDLERKKEIAEYLEMADQGEGVRIFIGSENKLFSLSGSSLVVSPYMNADRKVIGAVGVIGPTRLNYGRIVPIVDYTAQLIGKLMSTRE